MLSKIVDLVKSLFLYAFNHCNSLHCWFFITIINQAQSLVETGNSKAQAQVCAHTRTYTLYAKWLHDLQFNA